MDVSRVSLRRYYIVICISGMSCKKGDAFRCAGAGFRESDTFASQLHWDLQFQSGVLEVLNRAVSLGFVVARLLRKLRFCDRSQVKRRFWRKRVRVLKRGSIRVRGFYQLRKVFWNKFFLGGKVLVSISFLFYLSLPIYFPWMCFSPLWTALSFSSTANHCREYGHGSKPLKCPSEHPA